MSHETTDRAIRSGLVDQVGFTGSTAGGRMIMAAVAGAPNFPATCLELGGKDPAYVRPDANLAFAIENVVDAGYFNSGQSCCAVERIYVHEAVYDKFVEGGGRDGQCLQARRSDRSARRRSARWCARARPISCASQVEKAVRQGARPLIDPKRFAADRAGHALSGAAASRRRRPLDGDHDRGDLRAGARRHEGEVRRGSDPAHERFALRADRVDLDRGCRGGGADRRLDRDRHLVHEPRRLSRPGARLGRRQGIRPRRDAVEGRLRASDPAEELPPRERGRVDALPAAVSCSPARTLRLRDQDFLDHLHSGPARPRSPRFVVYLGTL